MRQPSKIGGPHIEGGQGVICVERDATSSGGSLQSSSRVALPLEVVHRGEWHCHLKWLDFPRIRGMTSPVVWCGVVWCGVAWRGVVCRDGVLCRRRCYQKAKGRDVYPRVKVNGLGCVCCVRAVRKCVGLGRGRGSRGDLVAIAAHRDLGPGWGWSLSTGPASTWAEPPHPRPAAAWL